MTEEKTTESPELTALQTRPNAVIGINMRELRDVADLIFKSKVFGDIQSQEAAAIKVLAGFEMGFTPFQSMSMFDFIQGRPTLNAHGKATLINSSGDFRLKINELTAKNCSISVVRKSDNGEWKTINTETFSWEDATTAGLTTGSNGHSWKKYPRNMLFARCVSNIWRWDTAELNVRKLKPGDIVEFEAEELNEDGQATNGNGQPYVEGELVEDTPPAETGPATEVIDGEVVDTSTGEVFEPVAIDEPDAEPEPAKTEESIIADLTTAIADRAKEIGMAKYEEILAGRRVTSMDKKALTAFLGELNKA